VLAASWWGKLKTTIQIIAIIIALISLITSNYHITTLNLYLTYSTYFSMGLAAIITIISGIDYFIKNYKVLDYNS
jgi:CDP-diacylglycerol--glycerol-3-phosphate 3-phosphatidyltransferase